MINEEMLVKCPYCGNSVIKTKLCKECGNPLNNAKPIIQNNNNLQPLSDKGLTLLVNTCKKKVATVGGDGYEEIVLYKNEDTDEYFIHTYSKYVYMEFEEHESYVATKDLATKVFKYIEENNLASWKNNKGFGMCGADYIIKFKHNDEIIRLDSTKMLDNLKAYADINKMLYSQVNETNRRYK